MPEFELIEGDPKGTSFGPLNRINIFVGANNSGKSRLMRRLMSKSSMVLSSGLDNKILENINEFANISNSSGLESVVIKSRNLDPNHSILRKSVELAEGLKGFPLFQYGGNLNLEFKKIASAIKNLQENYLHLFDFENWTRREQPYILGNKGGKPIAPDLFCDVNGRISLLLFEGFAIHEHTPLILRIPTFIDKAIELLIELLSPTIKDFVLKNHLTNFTLVGIDSVSLDALVEMSKLWKEVLASDPVNIERVKKRYIPVLRSAQRLWNKLPDENVKEETTRLLSEDNPHPSLFQITVKKHYSELLDSRIDVFNGQELFHKIIEARNGGSVSRSNFEDFESFLRKYFFPGRRVDVVAKVGDLSDPDGIRSAIMKQTISVAIDGIERDIQELGDGIQALIMLLFPIYSAEKASFIFIEEPELNLHPGMQRIFLDVISKSQEIAEKNLTFFITTHSNHFLDLTITENAPVSIFTLRKPKIEVEKFEIRNVLSGHEGILLELGVQSSSVYIANCSVWVEGHTDRKYIKKYLSEFQKAHETVPLLTEDLHFAFFEYGGANLVHYDFNETNSASSKIKAKRLSNAILIVGDRDQEDKPWLEKLSKANSDHVKYTLLERAKEIENLLSPDVLGQVLPKVFKKISGTTHKGEIELLKYNQYVSQPLLPYLKQKLGDESFPIEYHKAKGKAFSAEHKRSICDHSVEVLTWSNMSKEAQNLAKLVYRFIAESNGVAVPSLGQSDEVLESRTSNKIQDRQVEDYI